MRIISDYHDFYDCIQAHGQDQEFVYLRKVETTEYDKDPPKWGKDASVTPWPFPVVDKSYGTNKVGFYHQVSIVGFCGKIYPVVEVKNSNKKSAICHNLSEVDDFVTENYKSDEIKEYFSSKNKSYFSAKWDSRSRKAFNVFFKKCEEQKEQHQDIFLESRQPIFVAKLEDRWRYYKQFGKIPDYVPSTISHNAELKGLEFYRIFPTAVAYQEISMYLGGVLGQGFPHVPDISNNDMIESKGFDLKSSFRKPKQEKKRKKHK